MTGLALILALAVGQPEVKASDLAVRIQTSESGGIRGYGSGTILASNDRGEELVLTARHVTRGAQRAWVLYRGQYYPVKKTHESTRADLAAVEVNLPGTFPDTPLAVSSAVKAAIWGYGKSGNLHLHRMTRLTPLQRDDQYTPGGNEGDSGAGVFNESGELSGVFVAQRTDNLNAITVPSTQLCQFLGARQASSGRTRMVIFPFFWFRKDWSGGAGSRTCPPGQSCEPSAPIVQQPIGGVTVQAPGVGVQVGGQPEPTVTQGPAGQDGKPGKDGTNGKDAPPVDTAALANQITAAVIKEIQGNPAFVGKTGATGATGPAGPTGPAGTAGTPAPATAATTPPPIYFRFRLPDGTTTPNQVFTADKLDPTGKPFYAMEINTSQLPASTVPVAPIPTPAK